MKLSHALLVGCVALAASLSVRCAVGQTGGAYALKGHTIGAGDTSLSGGAYILAGTIAQPDAGKMSGGAYTLTGGFWPGVSSRPAAPVPLSQPSVPSHWLTLKERPCVAIRKRKPAKVTAFAGRHRGRTLYVLDTGQVNSALWREDCLVIEPTAKLIGIIKRRDLRVQGGTAWVNPEAVPPATSNPASGYRLMARASGSYIRLAIVRGSDVVALRVATPE